MAQLGGYIFQSQSTILEPPCVGTAMVNKLGQTYKHREISLQRTPEKDVKDQGNKRRVFVKPRRKSLPPLFKKSTGAPVQFNDDLTARMIEKFPALNDSKPPTRQTNDVFAESREGFELKPTAGVTLAPEPTVCLEPGLEEAEGAARADSWAFLTNSLWKGAGLPRQSRRLSETLEARQRQKVQNREVILTQQSLNFSLRGSKAKYAEHAVVANDGGRKNTGRTPLNRSKCSSMTSMEERMAKYAKQQCRRAASAASRKSVANKKPNPRKHVCLLACIRPNNLEEEKDFFMKSNYTYNPQFKYDYPLSDVVRARYNRPTFTYLPQAIAIMKRVIHRYGSYEKFEWATGGQLLTRTQLWNTVKRYLEREGFAGDVVVNISNEIIARGAMTINGGRPTLSIRETAAKKLWVEGLLRHEIGTHHLRFHNNRQQVWHNSKVRRQMGLKPANPTEEGLASLHSVLLRKDPSLWRSAVLYYTVCKASEMSFCELFEDLGQYVEDPEVRWDYCIRTKRGQTDTSRPGCFCKDQVYLTGLLPLLQLRNTLDFHMLSAMGKISYEDIEMLRPHFNPERTKIPSFMQDLSEYRRHLDNVVAVNGLEEFLQVSATNQEQESGGS